MEVEWSSVEMWVRSGEGQVKIWVDVPNTTQSQLELNID